MTAYIIRRLLLILPTLIGIMIINFAVVQVVPGGPVEQMIAQMTGTAVESPIRLHPSPSSPRNASPNIFSLYEANIGMLTPMIADDLREAESLYPASWIEDAFREAVEQNKRSWRYVERILERWSQEGKGNGQPRRYLKKSGRY